MESTPTQAQAPLRDYAMIGDCRTAAIVSKYGALDWLCLPDFDSPSVFGRLLDPDHGGFFQVGLRDVNHATQRYLPETAILETTLISPQGVIRLTDCMPVLPDMRNHRGLLPLREVLRRVEVISGKPAIEVTLDARPHYAKQRGKFVQRNERQWALRSGRDWLHLRSDIVLTQENTILRGEVTPEPGQQFYLSLIYERGSPAVLMPLGAEAETRINDTSQWWRGWCKRCKYQGEWRDEVLRSAITLRLMTFTQSGALLAAATTSLPERPQGWMNWDYRFCWPRDSAVTLSAFMHIGLHEEADAFFDWLMGAASTTRPRIQNIYDIYGRRRIREKFLPWLKGYHGAQPVRIGNAVTEQKQHDVYGEVMIAIENWVKHFGKPSTSERQLIEGFGRAVAEEWRNPDNSIWEIRDQQRHYTYSKVMAWYVFDSLMRLHEQGHVDGPIEMYRRERDALREVIEREAFNPERNCFVAVFGGDTMDASLLLLPRTGFVAYDDPRMLATWDAIQQDLEQNGLILRYPSGFGHSEKNEGAFMICNFWAVSYLSKCGRHKEARSRLKYLLSLANEAGLYSESIAPDTGKALGNMPQAFSHAGLINTLVRMQEAT